MELWLELLSGLSYSAKNKDKRRDPAVAAVEAVVERRMGWRREYPW